TVASSSSSELTGIAVQ
ncbi:colicin release lysis protein, partial [Escherichia coli]